MGQQYILIHNNPAPDTPAYVDWEERMRAKGKDPDEIVREASGPRRSAAEPAATDPTKVARQGTTAHRGRPRRAPNADAETPTRARQVIQRQQPRQNSPAPRASRHGHAGQRRPRTARAEGVTMPTSSSTTQATRGPSDESDADPASEPGERCHEDERRRGRRAGRRILRRCDERGRSDEAPTPVRPAAAQVEARGRRWTNEGEIAADYLEELLDIADLDGDIDTYNEGGRAHVSILTESDVLVGKDGEVLEALQELARLAVMTETGHRSRLMLDIAGHREQAPQGAAGPGGRRGRGGQATPASPCAWRR